MKTVSIKQKENIVLELLKNTTNISLKQFLIDYRLAVIKKNPLESDGMKRLDNCIEYIVSSSFDIKGWKLWEIPVFYSHCFLYHDHSKAFDLAVWDIGEVIPRYLDSSACEQDAHNIVEAIQKYDMYDYYMSITEF